jgi:hypothetical protein
MGERDTKMSEGKDREGRTTILRNVGKYLPFYKTQARYPYFDVVVGLVWSNDPESYAGGSIRYS